MYTPAKPALFFLAALSACFFVLGSSVHAGAGDTVFTEIMYNPAGADSDHEWVEIYNQGSGDVTIVEGSGNDSWRFNDGSNHTLTLIQGSLTIPAQGFAILADDAATFLADYPAFSGTLFDTVMSLNNTSDTLQLSADKGATFFNTVTYENAWGADGDGNTLEKINLAGGDGVSNWRASSQPDGAPGSGPAEPEPKAEEDTAAPSQSPPSASTNQANPKDVKISELYPNPADDEQNEFIEIWNTGRVAITITGWKLADKTKVYTIAEVILVPAERKVFTKTETSITLNNDTDAISLFDASGNIISAIEYEKVIKGYSYALDADTGLYEWTATVTRGAPNRILIPNNPPVPVITISPNPAAPNEPILFSAQKSTDPDNDELTCLWYFESSFQANGMQAVYSFDKTGTHEVTMIIRDPTNTIATTTRVTILPATDIISMRSRAKDKALVSVEVSPAPADNDYAIRITELFPNPAGRDDGEWIELYNPNNAIVSLEGWVLDDEDGGSKPYSITDRAIGERAYLILGKEETRITLNNSSDEVRLFNPEEDLVDSVPYDDVVEAQSFALSDEDTWYWTNTPTPGAENAWLNANETVQYYEPADSGAAGSADYPVDIALKDVRELELGTQVRLQGTVAVEPGILGKTYFYITGSQGIQVYFSKQDWPSLSLGDVVGVLGTLSEANNELRLKVNSKEDVIPLYVSGPPEPQEMQTGLIDETVEGALVAVQGEVTEKKGTSWYLDDGSGETRIVFQQSASIEKPKTRAGDWISIVGLVSETRTGYRILPRYQEDVSIISPQEDAGSVLGASIETNDAQRFSILENNQANNLLTYVSITAGALALLFIGLFIRLRVETKKRLNEIERAYREPGNE